METREEGPASDMSLLDLLFFRRTRLVAELHGHTGQVISLAISPNGKLIASGGTDGVRVWDLETRKEIQIPQQPLQERGQVSCVLWITRRNESFDTLCYGNALGYLVFLQHRPTERRFEAVYSARIARGGEILSLASNDSGGSSTRIATGTRDKCVQIWSFDSSTRKLVSVHSNAFSQEKDIVPKSLAFDNNEEQDLVVFGLYDGGMYGGEDGKWRSTLQLSSKIGNAAVDPDHRFGIIDNVGNGFDLYKLDTGEFIRTCATKEPTKTYPKGVAFALRGQAIVGGSDHGLVYIFDRRSAKPIHTLKYSPDGGVQTLAVHDGEEVVIAAASASTVGPIRIWKWRPKPLQRKRVDEGPWSAQVLLMWLMKGMVLLAAMAYTAQFAGFEKASLGGRRRPVIPEKIEVGVDYEALRKYIRKEMMAEMQMQREREGDGRRTAARSESLLMSAPVLRRAVQKMNDDDHGSGHGPRLADKPNSAALALRGGNGGVV